MRTLHWLSDFPHEVSLVCGVIVSPGIDKILLVRELVLT